MQSGGERERRKRCCLISPFVPFNAHRIWEITRRRRPDARSPFRDLISRWVALPHPARPGGRQTGADEGGRSAAGLLRRVAFGAKGFDPGEERERERERESPLRCGRASPCSNHRALGKRMQVNGITRSKIYHYRRRGRSGKVTSRGGGGAIFQQTKVIQQ